MSQQTALVFEIFISVKLLDLLLS